MKKKILSLLLAALMLLLTACAKHEGDPSEENDGGFSLTIGTTAAIETAVYGEYNYDMLASGVSELPLVYQDTQGEYHPLLAEYSTEDAATWT